MKFGAKKLVCFIMAFLLAAFSFQQNAKALGIELVGEIFGFYQPASSDWMTVPAEKNEEDVTARLEKLRTLAGSYFTANGQPCNPAPGSWVHGCKNCETTNLVNTSIFDLMPKDRGCLPSYHLYAGTMSNICQSCAAFATMAHWYLYAGESTDAVRTEKIASGVFNEETLSKAKPGDIIALSYVSSGRHYHSMIFIEHIAGGIRVIDNNWGTPTYGNCYVMERNSNYSSKYYAVISRAENFAEEIVPAEGIEISGDEKIILAVGDEKQLSAEIKPAEATDKTVTWSTSDPAVADISSDGLVKAVGAGTAEITVTTNDGGYTDSCTVEVTEKYYTVSYDANGGENAPESQEKLHGEDIIISEKIPSRAGWNFLGWASAADAAEPEYLPGETYSADADITLYAVWSQKEEKILYGDADENGKINVLDANLIRRSSAMLVSLSEKQFEISDVNGDGKVNILDASLVRKFSVRLIEKFPVEE